MVVEDADPRFATTTSETPSRENQEPQEAASGDENFFCRTHLRFFAGNLMKMSSNAKVLNLWGCARHGKNVTCSFLATGHADFEA